MGKLTIYNVDQDLLDALESEARREGVSLEKHVINSLRSARKVGAEGIAQGEGQAAYLEKCRTLAAGFLEVQKLTAPGPHQPTEEILSGIRENE